MLADSRRDLQDGSRNGLVPKSIHGRMPSGGPVNKTSAMQAQDSSIGPGQMPKDNHMAIENKMRLQNI